MTTLTEEQQGDADLEAGFANAPPKTTEKPVVAEVKADDPPKPDEQPPEPKVEYVQLTKEEHGRLLALVDKTNEWNVKLDRALGTVGGINEIVKKLQATTPAGVTVEYDDADFAELEENYPDLANQVKAILRKGKFKGTAPAAASEEPAPKKTEEPSAPSVAQQLIEQRVKDNMDMLNEAFPTWKDTVGFSLTGEEKAKLPYRIWLATKDEDYQKRLNNSQSALTIGRSIDEFHRDQRRQAKLAKQPVQPKKPDPKVAARQDRIAGSVHPRGDGGPPPRKDTADDDLNKGFYGTR